MQNQTETSLIVVERLDASVVFSDTGMTKLLDEIKTKVMAYTLDIDTETGRKDIASLAYKVTRSKTLIDNLGKGVVSDWKKKAKAIDAHRKIARDFLDNLKDKVRQPLTEWEAAEAVIKAAEEAKEKAKIETRVSELFALDVNIPFFDIAMLETAEYEKILSEATEKYQAEQDRLKKEAQARELEEKKLEETRKAQEAEAARLAKIEAAQEAKERALQAEQDKIEAEKKAVQDNRNRAEFERKAKEVAKIQAEKDAAEKMLREKKEKEDRLVAEKIEAERIEALKPDREKLNHYAQAILDIPLPDVKDERSQAICLNAKNRLAEIATTIIEQTDNL